MSLKSAKAACDFAAKLKLKCEVIVILDDADDETTQLIHSYQKMDSVQIDAIHSLNLKSLGGARNFGVLQSKGLYVAFLDGDDLFSENWLASAFKFAKANPHSIVHPELNIFFGAQNKWWAHIDQNSSDFDSTALIYHNYWTALSFCPRAILTRIPYHDFKRDSGFSFEDWHWNCETIAQGFCHRVAVGTCHFIRLKDSGSLNQESAENHSLIPFTKMYGQLSKLGLHMRIQIEFKKKMKTLVSIIQSRIPYLRLKLPGWARQQIERTALIEPKLLSPLQKAVHYSHSPKMRNRSDLFLACLNEIQYHQNAYDSVFLVENAESLSDAEKKMAQLKTEESQKSLLIFTAQHTLTHNSSVRAQAAFLDFGVLASRFKNTTSDLSFILTRLLLQIQPKTIHNLSSKLGTDVFKLYSRQLAQYSRLEAFKK